MLEIPLKIVFVLVSVSLIGIVLLQMSKHSGLGGAFGSGSTYTVFGREEEADPKRTATTLLAAAFIVLAIVLFVLTYLASPR